MRYAIYIFPFRRIRIIWKICIAIMEFDTFWCRRWLLIFDSLFMLLILTRVCGSEPIVPPPAVARLAANPLIASSGALPGAELIFKFQHRAPASARHYMWRSFQTLLAGSFLDGLLPCYTLSIFCDYAACTLPPVEFPRRPLLVG
jgi:hypothetical protein